MLDLQLRGVRAQGFGQVFRLTGIAADVNAHARAHGFGDGLCRRTPLRHLGAGYDLAANIHWLGQRGYGLIHGSFPIGTDAVAAAPSSTVSMPKPGIPRSDREHNPNVKLNESCG